MSRRKRSRKRRFPFLAFLVGVLMVVVGAAGHRFLQEHEIVLRPANDHDQPSVDPTSADPLPTQPDLPIPAPAASAAEIPTAVVDSSTTGPEPPAAEPEPMTLPADIDWELAPDQDGLEAVDVIADASGASASKPGSDMASEDQTADEPAADPMVRTWSDSAGKFKVEAKLIDRTNRSVTLERIDTGKKVTILVRRLSKVDQQFLKTVAADAQTAAAADTPLDPTATIIAGRVIRVSDGDTIDIEDPKHGLQRIRLLGIDAPEYSQRFGPEVRNWLGTQIFGKQVRAEAFEKDKYGRWTANIYLGNTWLNLELVKHGCAWHYTSFSDDARLADAQNAARAQRIGLWQDPTPTAPWKYRKQNRD